MLLKNYNADTKKPRFDPKLIMYPDRWLKEKLKDYIMNKSVRDIQNSLETLRAVADGNTSGGRYKVQDPAVLEYINKHWLECRSATVYRKLSLQEEALANDICRMMEGNTAAVIDDEDENEKQEILADIAERVKKYEQQIGHG